MNMIDAIAKDIVRSGDAERFGSNSMSIFVGALLGLELML
jgi:hypothetical protein